LLLEWFYGEGWRRVRTERLAVKGQGEGSGV
jgi:hypothetical protein